MPKTPTLAIYAIVAALSAAPASAQTVYKEAPDLAALVKDGKLPPVAERLPRTPRTVKPLDSVGVYGGTWNSGVRERVDSWARRVVSTENLVLFAPDWSGVVPNVAESYTVSADATVYTFRLREGMKWSDGKPFTSDDLGFVVEDVMTNSRLGGFPIFMRTSKGNGRIEKVGPYEVRFVFPAPNGLFLDGLASLNGDVLTAYPAHYMKQFHKKYNDGVDQVARAENVGDWTELFVKRGSPWENVDLPTLNPWRVTVPFGRGTQMLAVRNPYYWQVDTAGAQLPYIDRIAFTVFQDNQVLLLKALAGELDMHGRHINDDSNKAVLFDNRQRGNFRFYNTLISEPNAITMSFNQTAAKDRTNAALLANRDFRAGLSHALNRKEIVDVVYTGQCEIAQPSMFPEAGPLYLERLAKQHLEFDLAKSAAHLDRAGVGRKDAQGRRLGADGKPVELGLIIRSDKQEMIDAAELMIRQWSAVGVTARMEVVDRTLFRKRRETSDYDVMFDDHVGALRDVFLAPYAYIPTDVAAAYGVQWFNWFSGKANAPEPPAPVKKQLALWGEIQASAVEGNRIARMREILEIAADNFFDVGICQRKRGFGIVSNRMRNVPAEMPGAFQFASPKPSNPATYYFEGGRR